MHSHWSLLKHAANNTAVFAMEVRRIGDAILRARSSPILSFLAPHIPLRLWHRYSSINAAPPNNGSPIAIPCSTRTFTDSSVTRTEARPAARPEQASDSKSSPTGALYSENELDSLLDGVVGNYKQPASSSQRTSRSKPLTAQDHDRGNSGTDVRLAFQESSRANRGIVDVARMLDPVPQPSSQTSVSEQVRAEITPPPMPKPRLRLGPSIGRSVPIDPERGVDLGRGFRVLEINCQRNQVRGDFMRQRFHERPGLKRKRLHSLRWRKRFKEGFRAVVGKVEDMRRRGW